VKHILKTIFYAAADILTLNRGLGTKIGEEWFRFPARWSRYYESDYEPETFDFFRKNLKPGDIVFDIGAHIGLFSVVASRLVGETGKVYAFEPTPFTRGVLGKVIKLNGCDHNVEIRTEAVSEKKGTAYFFDTGTEVSNANSLVETSRSKKKLEVPVTSVDEFVAERGLLVNCLIGKRLPIYIDKWEAKTADYIVTLGRAVKQHLVSREGVPEQKIHVVYQGFDFERFSATDDERNEIREEFGIKKNEFLIGTFGNFFPTKGHRFLLDAVSLLIERYPNIRLLFVGSGGEEGRLADYVVKTGLKGKVIFAGFRKDVAACIKACELVVHPSLSEAFCQVLIETMSVGTPLISTDVGGTIKGCGNTLRAVYPASW